jgi:uncharacterized Zn finger protein (UPF0148 family)
MSFRKTCPNCGSNKFQETISREYCPNCGIECLYHGGGANDKYKDYCERKWAREAEEDEIRFAKLYEEQWGEPYNG